MNLSEHSPHSEQQEEAHFSGAIMVLDDNADVRQLLACALEMSGFAVIKAATEIELQRLLAHVSPDALLIDLQRAPAEGLHVLERMRRRQALRDMPILFLASSDGERLRDQATRAGADWFGERPLSMLELQRHALELVQRRRRARSQSRVS